MAAIPAFSALGNLNSLPMQEATKKNSTSSNKASELGKTILGSVSHEKNVKMGQPLFIPKASDLASAFPEETFEELVEEATSVDIWTNENEMISRLMVFAPNVPKEELIKLSSNILLLDIPATVKFKMLEQCSLEEMLKAAPAHHDPFQGNPFHYAFSQLLLENPELALQIIQKYKLEKHPFKDIMIFIPARVMKAPRDEAFVKCYEALKTNPTFNDCMWIRHFSYFIKMGAIKTFEVIVKNLPKSFWEHQEILDQIFAVDDPEFLKVACEVWGNNIVDISKIPSIVNIPRCLRFIAQNTGLTNVQKQQIATDASGKGFAHIVLIACNDHDQTAVGYIFAEIIPLLEILDKKDDSSVPDELRLFTPKFEKIVYKLLRFSPIEIVGRLVQKLAENYPSLTPLINRYYTDFKTGFLRVSPFFSRYTEEIQFKSVHEFYTDKPFDFMVDLSYGAFCRKHVERLVKTLHDAKQVFKPTQAAFKGLPPSSKGTQRAAALLEEIAKTRAEKQKERHSKGDHEAFHKLRTPRRGMTMANGLYRWGQNLVSGVYLAANSVQTEGLNIALSYKGVTLTLVSHTEWRHGQAEIEKTWSFIENILEEILAMNLKRPENPSAAEKEAYKQCLNEFYAKTAELVWLIGNTQPLIRGTGTVAEWMLGIVHLYHGMEPPTLKTEFPQLDVLDITFPPDKYPKIFPYFFEQSTLPEELRRAAFPSTICNQVRTLLTSG